MHRVVADGIRVSARRDARDHVDVHPIAHVPAIAPIASSTESTAAPAIAPIATPAETAAAPAIAPIATPAETVAAAAAAMLAPGARPTPPAAAPAPPELILHLVGSHAFAAHPDIKLLARIRAVSRATTTWFQAEMTAELGRRIRGALPEAFLGLEVFASTWSRAVESAAVELGDDIDDRAVFAADLACISRHIRPCVLSTTDPRAKDCPRGWLPSDDAWREDMTRRYALALTGSMSLCVELELTWWGLRPASYAVVFLGQDVPVQFHVAYGAGNALIVFVEILGQGLLWSPMPLSALDTCLSDFPPDVRCACVWVYEYLMGCTACGL